MAQSSAKSVDAVVDQLKLTLVKSKDLSDIMTFFFDELMAVPGFMAMGVPCQGDATMNRIIGAVETIYRQQFPGESAAKPHVLSLLRLKKYKFFHGSCIINGKLGALFFFEDLDMGLVSLGGMPPDHQVMHFRFQAVQLPDDQKKRGYQVDRSGYRH